jgi:hypothetical protein
MKSQHSISIVLAVVIGVAAYWFGPYMLRNPSDAFQTANNHELCAGPEGQRETLIYMATHRDRYPCSVRLEAKCGEIDEADIDELDFE